MKRVLSLVLALVLVLGTILPVFAEEVSTSGEQLKALGVIAGTENGLDEDLPLTRGQAAAVIAEMYGKKAEAAAYAFPSSFTDVEEGIWYTPYIAYAEAQGWMSGDGEGLTFRPTDIMSANDLNAMYCVVLGYEATWGEEANAKAAELGFAVDAADDTLVLRGEAFTTILAALDVMPMDETDTLGTKLALEGYEAPAPATPDAFEVASVEMINLVQTQVMFNQEVDADSAETAGNYTITDTDDNDIAISAADLLEDGKTVVLTHANAGQQTVAVVEVEDTETAEEVVVEDYTSEEITYLDMAIPTALSAEVVGVDTIKVTFSEPVTTATLLKANFEVDGGDLYINTVEAFNNNTEANITLYSDLDAGDVTVKVTNDVEDEAGFGVVGQTFTVTVTEDEDAPVVVGFKDATTTGVTLIFSEEIEIDDATLANYYHTNGNSPVKAAPTLSDDGKELTLVFDTDESLPQGTAYVYVADDSVNDLWDNLNEQQMIAVEVTLDVTAPEVEEIDVVTESQITVEFTEDVTDADEVDNYTLLDSDGEEVEDAIDNISYNSTTYIATIDFEDTLSGVHSLVIDTIEDASENEIAATTIEFEVDDLTAPVYTDFTATLYKSGLTGQMIRVEFDEEMNAEGLYSVIDPANYTIGGTDLTELEDDYTVEISLTDGGKTVQIEVSIDDPLTTGLDEVEGVTLTDADNIVLARVSDAAGNYTAAFYGNITVDSAATVGVESVELTEVDTVVVTFDDLLSEFDADDFKLESDSGTELTISKRAIAMNDDGNTEVTLTLAADLTYIATIGTIGTNDLPAHVLEEGDIVNLVTEATVTSENQYGEALVTGTTVLVADATSPELFDDGATAVATNATLEDYLVIKTDNTFLVAFTEVVTYTSNVLAGNDFVVTADNDTLVNGIDFSVTALAASGITGNVAGNTAVEFTLLGDYVGFDGDIEVALADSTSQMTDANENDLVEFETGDFAVLMGGTVASASYMDLNNDGAVDTVKLVMTEAVDDSTFDNTDALTVTGFGTADATAGNYSLNTAFADDVDDDKTIYITLDTLGAANTTYYAAATVNVPAGMITDLNGSDNTVAVAAVTMSDKASPVVVSADFADATTLDVVYSEAVTTVLADYTAGALDSSGGAGTAVSFTISAIAGSGTANIDLTVAGNATIITADVAVMAIAATVVDVAGNALTAVPTQAVGTF